MKRRDFLKKIGLASAAFAVAPVVMAPPQALHYANNDWDFKDALAKQMMERMDEIAFEAIYRGTVI